MLVYDLPCVEEHNTANTTSFTTSNIIALEKILLILIQSYSSNWASEASPTLGCSIEISRDIQARTQDFEKGGSEYRVAVRLRRRGGCGIRAKLLHYE